MGDGKRERRRTGRGRRARKEGGNLGTVGRICATLQGSLRVGRCRLDSAPTTSVTAERGVGDGTPGDVPGRHGPGNPPGDENHRWYLHPWVGRIQRHRGGCAKPTPWRCHTFLPLQTPLRSGGGGEVWSQCAGFPISDGGATVVHRRGVHRSRG